MSKLALFLLLLFPAGAAAQSGGGQFSSGGPALAKDATVNSIAVTGLSAGQAVFPNASKQLTGSPNFFWDSTNNRLGIGTSASSPNAQLQVGGQVTLNAGDAVTGFFNVNRSSGQAWALNTNCNLTVLGETICLENDINNMAADAPVDYTVSNNLIGGTSNICAGTNKCNFAYKANSASVATRFHWGYISTAWDTAGFAAIADTTTPIVTQPSFYSFTNQNALHIGVKLENGNGVSPIAAIGFCVSQSGVETTAPTGGPGPCKAGIGLQRSLANGRGIMYFYNRSVNDTSDFTSTDNKMGFDQNGHLGISTAPDAVAVLSVSGLSLSTTYGTTANCSSAASPAVCGLAAAGSFVIAAAATSVTVNTTAVTANSQIILTEDSSLGTKLGVTCNTQSLLVLGPPKVTARVATTSFTAAIEVGPTTNPLCVSYSIVN